MQSWVKLHKYKVCSFTATRYNISHVSFATPFTMHVATSDHPLMKTLHNQKRASCSKSAITKTISGCVRIACFGLMITSLLQVVNRHAASCELHAGLMQGCFINMQQVCKCQVAAGLMQLDDVNRLDITCWQITSGW